MYLVVSGEGNSDIGYCTNSANECEVPEFQASAMMIMIDKLIQQIIQQRSHYEYSVLDLQQVSYVTESHLSNLTKALPTTKKKMALAGKKRQRETLYFQRNAQALAQYAQKKQEDINTPVVAVLFRDGDGTNSSARGEWQAKYASMKKGFALENFEYGIAMIPKPKSEAWLLCAIKDNPYIACDKLEDESGNDNSPNSLKKQLATAMENYDLSIEDLLIEDIIKVDKIDMPSFNCFKDDLENTIIKLQ